MSMRPTSAHLKSILPKFLLIPFQKSINTHANPGALFMEIYPPADLLHCPFKKIADFKISKPTTTKLNK